MTSQSEIIYVECPACGGYAIRCHLCDTAIDLQMFQMWPPRSSDYVGTRKVCVDSRLIAAWRLGGAVGVDDFAWHTRKARRVSSG
jgi:hypothetical protein